MQKNDFGCISCNITCFWALMSQLASKFFPDMNQRNDDPAFRATTGCWQWHHTSCGVLGVCAAAQAHSLCALRPCKMQQKKKKNPIFILIRFHYQLFLLVSESIVFPDRLRAREDLDNTAGRQPLLKMHGLVWGASNCISVKPNVLCICKDDSPIISCVSRLRWELKHKCEVLPPYSYDKCRPSCWFSVSLLCECRWQNPWTLSSLHIGPV